jgi:hypothetical protein
MNGANLRCLGHSATINYRRGIAMSKRVPVFYIDGVQLPLTPTYAALVAAEGELGPIFCIVERAAEGSIQLSEVAALFDHLSHAKEHSYTREQIGEKLTSMGLANVAPILKRVLSLILRGAEE